MTQWPNLWPTLSAPLPAPKLRVLSLGAGVQSTTLALAAARGDVGPMPDCAIFADTGWEPRAVYEHLDRLRGRLPFPVHIVSAGSLRDAAVAPQQASDRFAVPFHTRLADGSTGIGKRQCTKNFKLAPIRKKVRELLGQARPAPDAVEQWVGISMDEASRMKPAHARYIHNRWPVIEADMTRRQCVTWMAERQESAPRSACRGCPFKGNAEWRDMRDNSPDEWEETCAEDDAIRHLGPTPGAQQFMHRSCVRLADAPIDAPDSGQFGFDMHCEGMCGV